MVPITQLPKPSLVLSLSLLGGGDSVTSHVSWPRIQTLPASHSPLVGTRLFLKWNRKSYSLVQKPKGYFPGSPVVKNPPSDAGHVGSTPGWGAKIPHAMGQPSLYTADKTHVYMQSCLTL